MLVYLHIRDFAIIDAMELDFSAGFTCVTGETGAGKSILVGALGMLTGDRADVSTVREGADRAELAAEFELDSKHPARYWLEQEALADGSQCLLRRVILASGRSRAWINGSAVTLGQLSELGRLLVEIHGQNEHLQLLQKSAQFQLLDRFHGERDALDQVHERCKAWSALEKERLSLLEQTPLDAGDARLIEYQIEELRESVVPAEQFRKMEDEHRRLARGGEALQHMDDALQALEDDAGGISIINRCIALLQGLAEEDSEIGQISSLLQEASINCEEARSQLQAVRDGSDLNPARLQELEQQISAQHGLARKHRCEPDQLESVAERLQQRLEDTGQRDRRLSELETELTTVLDSYRKAAEKVTQIRNSAAEQLSGQVTELMQSLGLEGGQFELNVSPRDLEVPSERGQDDLDYRVSANAGTSPAPLAKVASGGELSRISLALKVASQEGKSLSVQIFDEVDAGIGGETATTVGSLIKSLSENSQALCVTHLAQVAVFADHQIQVQKQGDSKRTEVQSQLLNKESRIDEIARMLGGQISEQSRAHASELLDTARVRH